MSKFINIKNHSLLAFVILPVIAIALFWVSQGRANAPPGRYSTDEFTVTDNKTGLVWERIASPTQKTAIEANTYCQNLALSGAKWRLPSMKELQTLVDESVLGPAIDSSAFPGTTAGNYWSSSTVLPVQFSSWVVDFSDGKTNTLASFGTNASVRCVY